MAQLRDTIVSGNLRVTDTTLTDTLHVTTIKAPTSSGGTTYGPGTNGQILKSNGTTTYWAADSNTDTKVKVTASTSKAYLIGTTTSPDGTAVEGVGNTGVYMTNGVLTTSSVHTTGDVVLGTSSSSSDDSGDIYWKYGNGQEKARLWQSDTYTTKAGPAYRIYKSDGTSLYSGNLPLADGTSASGTWGISITGTSSNVTGTVAIANGGTGATTRLNALKALTNENVGTNATYFLTITNSYGKGGYTSVADAKTVLGLKSAAYTESSDYLKLSGGTLTGAVNFANNTMNKLGDDVQFGDGNVAGHMIVQGLNNTTGINLKYASDSYPNCNMTVTTKSCANKQFIGLYNYEASGTGIVIGGGTGGLMVLGSGESPTTFHGIMGSASTNPLGNAWYDETEKTLITSDNEIYFMSGAQSLGSSAHTDWTHCKTIVFDNSGNFKPTITLKGSLGDSSYYWNSAYIHSLTLSNTSELIKSSGTTYYYAERSDTDVRIGFGVGTGGTNHGVYSYKLEGWLIYGNETDVFVRANLYNPSTEASLYALPLFGGTPSTGAHALYNNDGFRYSTLEGTTSAPGLARLILGNGRASGIEGNKCGTIRLYSQSSNCIDLVPASTSSARTITIPAVTATMAVNRKALIKDDTSDYASYPWHKFAEVTITTGNYDYVAIFLVSSGYYPSLRKIGMLTMHVRTSSTKIFGAGEFEWLYASMDIDPTNFVMTYTNTANTSCKVELWCKQTLQYGSYTFNVIEEHTRTDKEIYTMTLYDQNGHGYASIPSVTDEIPSTLGRIKNAPGIYPVKGTQTASTSAWTGSIDVSELYDGLTIAYYLPYASTSTSVTLNLTLADGTTTGAINCYETSSNRITAHYGVGSTVILTYWSAATSGQSDNRWTRCDYSTISTNQTNTTTNADYRVLFSTNANDTTQSGTTRKNINLQYNPSTATLKIGDFVSSSTATKNGKLVFGNSLNVYTHTINTNTDKLSNVSLTLNSTDGIMGTDALCYKGYESANLSSDTVPGTLADISSLSNAVSFSGYLARFSYFTALLCVGTDVTARTTVQVSAIAGYQSYQLIWGGAPNHSGGNLSITSGLVNITESSGTITLNFGKCASYWQFSSSSSTPTKGTTPNIHVLKVYGHCIRSNGYH